MVVSVSSARIRKPGPFSRQQSCKHYKHRLLDISRECHALCSASMVKRSDRHDEYILRTDTLFFLRSSVDVHAHVPFLRSAVINRISKCFRNCPSISNRTVTAKIGQICATLRPKLGVLGERKITDHANSEENGPQHSKERGRRGSTGTW